MSTCVLPSEQQQSGIQTRSENHIFFSGPVYSDTTKLHILTPHKPKPNETSIALSDAICCRERTSEPYCAVELGPGE